MKGHAFYSDRLAPYAAGQLDEAARAEIDAHLKGCAECRSDLALWREIGSAVAASDRRLVPPQGIAERALARIRASAPFGAGIRWAWQLLKTQAGLVQSELWPASTLIMGLGLTLALFTGREGVMYFLAPMVAAAGLAAIYGSESDPVIELTHSTPTSAWKILLARLTLVSGFNLLLALAAGLVLVSILPAGILGNMVLTWLGPMTFLSALALLFSLWIGAGNAIAISYSLWLAQFLVQWPSAVKGWQVPPAWAHFSSTYQAFWHNPALLFILAAVLVGLSLLSAGRSERLLSRPAA
jgi:anti-sigma factor RsiW